MENNKNENDSSNSSDAYKFSTLNNLNHNLKRTQNERDEELILNCNSKNDSGDGRDKSGSEWNPKRQKKDFTDCFKNENCEMSETVSNTESSTDENKKTSFKADIEMTQAKEADHHYGIRVRTEDEMKLREFDVLDEIGPYDNVDMAGESCAGGRDNASINDYDYDDFSEDEIDVMLEEALESNKKKNESEKNNIECNGVEKQKKEFEDEKDYEELEKIVMVEKVKNHFEVLPDGWVAVTHNSGIPLYLHRASRVCTLSKPYFLGPGSARKHEIPLSAIPCLEYKRAKEEEIKVKNEENKSKVHILNGNEIPNARLETVLENEQSRQLKACQVREYCQNLFEFETIKVTRFKSWLARRKFAKEKYRRLKRPTLPRDTKLIACPIKMSDGKSGRTREWIMNPNGKSYVCILHEYIQRALKDQPVYTFKELENTATPYLATVNIGNVQYGTGCGSSKKQAKHDAAKATLEILIPEMKAKMEPDNKLNTKSKSQESDLSVMQQKLFRTIFDDIWKSGIYFFFDEISIEDPRVTELCVKTTEPLPHAILLTCLQRNFGLNETNIKYETAPLKHSKNEFTMTVGNHTAKVVCQNKRDGKQKAAQAILQALHPHVHSWGSLLRLYGNTSVKTVKEKKMEEQEITLLQNRGTSRGPNYAILNKLKEEMKKLKEMKNAVRPIGKFIPPDDIELPEGSSAELSNVLL